MPDGQKNSVLGHCYSGCGRKNIIQYLHIKQCQDKEKNVPSEYIRSLSVKSIALDPSGVLSRLNCFAKKNTFNGTQ